MKKLAILAATALAAALLATPALAEEDSSAVGVYANLGYTYYDTPNANLGGVTGRLGYRFTPNIAAEAEATGGVSSDSNAKLNDAEGVYGVGILPVSSQFDLFGRVGWQRISIDGRNGYPNEDKNGVGYGAGVEWRVANNWGVRGQYTRLEGGADTNAWELAATAHF